MHIKKLEICGFKSFVDKTVIHFDHDMIGVVGPNGCGKSNVVDAIRWVMGEQSAKALRGKAMGDIIFNGSESRPQAGFAEVTITFDNNDAQGASQLPLEYQEYSELSVTRRVYRGDGSNDYFINKAPVRLRDVTEVFLGTGVGRKAYSIVEQGKIGLIVSARAEDRRGLIEEAAGITKYKARRRQAENKMDATRLNLTRVNDIVSEIERQLDSLKRQSAKAERYIRYRDELDDLVLWDASHKLLELTVVTQVAENGVSEAKTRVAQDRQSVTERDAEIEVMRADTQGAEHQTQQAQDAAFVSDNEVRQHTSQIERASDRFHHLDERLRQARQEQLGLEAKDRGTTEERDTLAAELERISSDQSRERELVEAEAEKLRSLGQQATQAEQDLSGLRQQEARLGHTIAGSEAELRAFQQRQGESTQRQERLDTELARLDGEHAGLGIKGSELRQLVTELVATKDERVDDRNALATDLPGLKEAVAKGDRALQEARKTLQQKASRLRALQEIAERMEGLGAGVRNLLSTGDATLAGIVADRIDVPERCTAAVAGLIGERLQCVVIDDVSEALLLLRGLAADRGGRASVIPHLAGSGLASLGPLPAQEGLIGRLVEELRFASADAPLVHALVGDAVLVASTEAARCLRAKLADVDIVTLDGTVFHSDGRITGGAGDALASGMLDQKREVRELEMLVVELQHTSQLAETHVEALRDELQGHQHALDQARSAAHAAELSMVTGQQNARRVEEHQNVVATRRREVGAEVDKVASAIEQDAIDRAATLERLTRAQTDLALARASLLKAQELAAATRDALSEQQAAFTDRKVQLASVSERANACADALTRLQREHQELAERIERLETEREQAATEAGSAAAEIMLAREGLLDSKLAARQAHAAFEDARLSLEDARHRLSIREAELREMRASLEDLSNTLRDREMQLQRHLMAREHLDEGVRERFRGLELKTIVGDHHARPAITDEDRRRTTELTRLIDRMGSVNLDAMKEYEQSSERFEYYSGQRNDLETALEHLESAILQMNQKSERLFKHAFEGINRRFKELFPKMFRGGRAELRLTDPEDMLDTGIDIIAQPPGKRVANIELMSGGEKAFTAVSLLFAIFRYKPSPFCILDEVDAPLDEANIARYVEAIRAMTDRSQFILITHSKRSMQAVDVLYGVTMQEPGVSKLVGVRVNDGETRSQRTNNALPASEGVAEEAAESAAGSGSSVADEEGATEVVAGAVA